MRLIMEVPALSPEMEYASGGEDMILTLWPSQGS